MEPDHKKALLQVLMFDLFEQMHLPFMNLVMRAFRWCSLRARLLISHTVSKAVLAWSIRTETYSFTRCDNPTTLHAFDHQLVDKQMQIQAIAHDSLDSPKLSRALSSVAMIRVTSPEVLCPNTLRFVMFSGLNFR